MELSKIVNNKNGILSFGFNCFINTGVQCLRHTPSITSIFEEEENDQELLNQAHQFNQLLSKNKNAKSLKDENNALNVVTNVTTANTANAVTTVTTINVSTYNLYYKLDIDKLKKDLNILKIDR